MEKMLVNEPPLDVLFVTGVKDQAERGSRSNAARRWHRRERHGLLRLHRVTLRLRNEKPESHPSAP